ncbi:hypothetical protein [Amycolatopsis alkalitolerans]|uniref:Uncharacterized protein n=1 Tax=Amycolatopsis alkalitolerans TaxID=2547244 RepID=A0A5C4LT77_9PSEU|nr:hypothetical protein [Amycolatopsis alkalitolerans]TNC20568.1 hypothetical protein FG385_30555 [Amycolatopsis alkalitolerans]
MADRIKLVLPADERRLIVRVEMDREWVGDLLCTSASQQAALLSALSAGAVSVVTRPIPRPDWGILEPPVPSIGG